MNKKRQWKPILTIVLVIWCAYYVTPSLIGVELPLAEKKLGYGLDLKGGLELRYTVDYKRAIGDNTWKVSGLLRDRLIANKLGKLEKPEQVEREALDKYREMVSLEKVDYKSVRLTLRDEMKGQLDTVDDEFITQWADSKFVESNKDESSFVLMIKYEEGEKLKKAIIDQTMDIIRKRINAFGLVEPDVRRAGDADIDVQLPGVEKSKMNLVRAMIGQTAQLMFRLIETEKGDPLRDVEGDVDAFNKKNPRAEVKVRNDQRFGVALTFLEADRKSDLLKCVRFIDAARESATPKKPPLMDENHMLGYEAISTVDPTSKKEKIEGWRTHYAIRNMIVGKSSGAPRPVSISGDRITRAQVAYDQQGAPYASLDFDGAGAKDFGDVTSENVNKFLAIMLDDEIKSAPQIEEAITGGRARITLGRGGGQDNVREAQALVTVLTHGAYKAPVHKVHDHFVGPSLGAAAIEKGVLALVVGAVFVIGFVIFYYRLSGAIAIMALTLNVLFVVAILVAFNAALTLPGIAGIVLTIGMAIDANVIIFERIREEIRAGKSVRAAVDTGYAKAFWTVFDANVTTALAGFILLTYTTGPIYGFAVTLLAGIISSMFTAIVVTRMVFNWLINSRNIQELSI